MSSHSAAVIVAIATIATLTACGPQAAPVPESTSAALLSDGTTADDNHIDEPLDDAQVLPAATATAQSQADAIAAATAVLGAFGRPDLDYDTWWAQLLPLISEQAGVTYATIDPTRIPVRRITGVGYVLEGSTEVSLIVQVPTDAGLYNVTLIRTDPGRPWLADRIRPAQG